MPRRVQAFLCPEARRRQDLVAIRSGLRASRRHSDQNDPPHRVHHRGAVRHLDRCPGSGACELLLPVPSGIRVTAADVRRCKRDCSCRRKCYADRRRARPAQARNQRVFCISLRYEPRRAAAVIRGRLRSNCVIRAAIRRNYVRNKHRQREIRLQLFCPLSSTTMGSSGLGSTSSQLYSGGGGNDNDFNLVLHEVASPGTVVKKGQVVAEFDRQYMLLRLGDFKDAVTQNASSLKSQTADFTRRRKRTTSSLPRPRPTSTKPNSI